MRTTSYSISSLCLPTARRDGQQQKCWNKHAWKFPYKSLQPERKPGLETGKKKIDLTQTGSSIYQSIPKSSISAVWDLHRIHMLNLRADVQIWTTKKQMKFHLSFNCHDTNWTSLFPVIIPKNSSKTQVCNCHSLQSPLQIFPWGKRSVYSSRHWDWASLTNQSLLHSSWGLALDHASEQAHSVSSLFLNQGWPQVVGLALLIFWLQASQSSTLILQYPICAYMHIIIKNECLKYTAKWKLLWRST